MHAVKTRYFLALFLNMLSAQRETFSDDSRYPIKHHGIATNNVRLRRDVANPLHKFFATMKNDGR